MGKYIRTRRLTVPQLTVSLLSCMIIDHKPTHSCIVPAAIVNEMREKKEELYRHTRV